VLSLRLNKLIRSLKTLIKILRFTQAISRFYKYTLCIPLMLIKIKLIQDKHSVIHFYLILWIIILIEVLLVSYNRDVNEKELLPYYSFHLFVLDEIFLLIMFSSAVKCFHFVWLTGIQCFSCILSRKLLWVMFCSLLPWIVSELNKYFNNVLQHIVRLTDDFSTISAVHNVNTDWISKIFLFQKLNGC
jgi:hypothetical protein